MLTIVTVIVLLTTVVDKCVANSCNDLWTVQQAFHNSGNFLCTVVGGKTYTSEEEKTCFEDILYYLKPDSIYIKEPLNKECNSQLELYCKSVIDTFRTAIVYYGTMPMETLETRQIMLSIKLCTSKQWTAYSKYRIIVRFLLRFLLRF